MDKETVENCYMLISMNKKNIEVEIYLEDTNLALKRWSFNKHDRLRIDEAMFKVRVKDYEDSYC